MPGIGLAVCAILRFKQYLFIPKLKSGQVETRDTMSFVRNKQRFCS